MSVNNSLFSLNPILFFGCPVVFSPTPYVGAFGYEYMTAEGMLA